MKPTTKKQTNSQDTTLVSVWVPRDLERALKAEAKRRDLTKSQLIREALRQQTKQPA